MLGDFSAGAGVSPAPQPEEDPHARHVRHARTAPTVSGQLPGAFAPDGYRVNVFDKNKLASNNLPDVVHSVAIAAGHCQQRAGLGGG